MDTPNLHDLFFEIAEEIRAKKGYAATKGIKPIDFPNEISTIGTNNTPEPATVVPSMPELMKQIADAIRYKTGESGKILPTEFTDKISNINPHTHNYYYLCYYLNDERHRNECSCGAYRDNYHSWSKTKGKLASAATCSSYAQYYYYCYSCSHYSEEIAWADVEGGLGPHNWDANNSPYHDNATCTEPEKIWYYCTICNAKANFFEQGADPLGHAWQYVDDVYENGVHFYYWKCSRCGIEASTTTGQPPSK